MTDDPRTMPAKCKIHGKEVPYVSSPIAKAYVCIYCIAEGFFIETIAKEATELYPALMASARRSVEASNPVSS